MSSYRRRWSSVTVALVLVLLTTGCAYIVRSSVSSGEAQGDGLSGASAVSDDGRFLAFASSATNLAADANPAGAVLLRDHRTGSTSTVSVADDESTANGASSSPSISDDGRLVAFVSRADNLVPGDTNGLPDVFVRDVVAGTTRRVSAIGASVPTVARSPVISGNGRHVVYVLTAELAPGIPIEAVVTTDLLSGTSKTITAGQIQPPIEPATFSSLSVSDDGAYVMYRFSARHSLGIVFSGFSLWERATDTGTSIAGASSPAVVGNAALSGDGNTVLFSSPLDVVPETDTCSVEIGVPSLPAECDADVFAWRRTSGSSVAVSAPSPGNEMLGEHDAVAISDSAAVALLSTTRPDLPGSPATVQARDVGSGETQAVTAPAPVGEVAAVLSGDGKLVALATAQPLVPDDTNGVGDVFVRRTFLPVLAEVVPGSAARGTTVALELHGQRFEPGTGVGALGRGVSFSNVTVVDAATIRLSARVDPTAPTERITVFVVAPPLLAGTQVGAASTACFGCLAVT